MSIWKNMTPEKRKATIQKSNETKRRNKAERERKKEEAEAILHYKKNELDLLQKQIEEIKSTLSHRLIFNNLSKSSSGKRLLFKDEIIKQSVNYKSSCGIYFLIENNDVVYVGQSIDVHSRIHQHSISNKAFDSFSWIETRKNNLDVLESLYIHTLQPKYNFSDKGNLVVPINLIGVLGL